nr:MAG TPA: hypothetical protein [Caudoviricetes sp.]
MTNWWANRSRRKASTATARLCATASSLIPSARRRGSAS